MFACSNRICQVSQLQKYQSKANSSRGERSTQNTLRWTPMMCGAALRFLLCFWQNVKSHSKYFCVILLFEIGVCEARPTSYGNCRNRVLLTWFARYDRFQLLSGFTEFAGLWQIRLLRSLDWNGAKDYFYHIFIQRTDCVARDFFAEFPWCVCHCNPGTVAFLCHAERI